MKRVFVALFFTVFSFILNAQFIDKYGLKLGTSYSKQLWDYKFMQVDNSDTDYAPGVSVFIIAEKNLNAFLSIRSEIGYAQKGFKNEIDFVSMDGSFIASDKGHLILHNFCIDLGQKISPFQWKWKPYEIMGFCCDYMFSYRDVYVEETASGLSFPIYKSTVEEFNKFNLGAYIGFGLEFNDLLFMEMEYNPSITKTFDSSGLEIRDLSWSINMGVNINKLLWF